MLITCSIFFHKETGWCQHNHKVSIKSSAGKHIVDYLVGQMC